MLTKRNNMFLNTLGLFFITLAILAVYNTIKKGNLEGIFWFCYLGLLLIGIGILLRNGTILASQLNILIIPLIVWAIDFSSYFLIGGRTIFGFTEYMFVEGRVGEKLISLQHLFTIPLSLYALKLIKLKNKSTWKISIAQLVALSIVVLLFTSKETNINCIYSSCLNFLNTNSSYPLIWISAVLIIIYSTSKIINKFFLSKSSE
ncbi:MAG: hypothetical protein IH845_01950 [Nanoarchaeota archaeon]|nr:hypothetical protein [Nanoarchaeota archaeon]